MYGPEFLLTQDIVLVTPHYRVGLLGFLCLEDTSLDIPGNAGLKDQRLALRWVQRNIRKFNGDPSHVTLFGHSAGAISCHYHLFSPSSSGLFHKAILLSGSVFWTWSKRTHFCLKKFMDLLGIEANNDYDILEALKKLTAKQLLEFQEKFVNVSIVTNHIVIYVVISRFGGYNGFI